MTTAPDTSGVASGRLRALDGLRGLAALVVVVQHAVQVLPATDRALYGSVPFGSASWWLTYTPAHILWLGPEAVMLFFVLSGFVLALPATAGNMSWVAYYPRRILRLYVPVWGSLALAVTLAVLVPRTAEPGMSVYVLDRAQASVSDAGREGALLLGGGWLLNGPLWSLRWELLFSLLLPAYVLFATKLRRSLTLSIGLILAVMAVGVVGGSPSALYLPVFALGVVMAFHRDRLDAWGAHLRSRPHGSLLAAGLAGLAVLLLTFRWTAAGLGLDTPVDTVAPLIGACLVLFLALHWPRFSRAMRSTSLQWVGRCSFSLYVVHEPVIITTAMLLPVGQAAAAAVLGPVLAVLVAASFYRWLERPSVRWSRNAGRCFARWWEAWRGASRGVDQRGRGRT